MSKDELIKRLAQKNLTRASLGGVTLDQLDDILRDAYMGVAREQVDECVAFVAEWIEDYGDAVINDGEYIEPDVLVRNWREEMG